MASKVCNSCKEEKNYEDFPKRSDRSSGYYGTCKLCYYARKKRARKKNPEQYRKTRVAWVEKNRDKCREADRKWYYNNQDKKLAYKKDWERRNPERRILKNAKYRAKKIGVEFNLELSDIMIPDICPVLGLEILKVPDKKQKDSSPSLDRIDNTKGYVKGNVAVICYRANWLKNNANVKEIEAILRYMKGETNVTYR